MLKKDTPFKRLPGNLDPIHLRFYEGIRFALEAIELASQRLARILLEISGMPTANEKIPGEVFAAVLIDAWSVVDSVHRLYELVEATPGLRKKEPPVALFLRAGEKLGGLRNSFHHARERFHELPFSETSLWGTVSWIVSRENYLEGYTLVPGTIVPGSFAVADPRGRIIRPPIDLIVLKAFTHSAELSQLYRTTRKLAAYFEAGLERAIKSTPRSVGAACDMVVAMEIRPVPDGDDR